MTAAGWKTDVTPGTVIFTLAVLFLGVPAALILAALGFATMIGAVMW